MREREIVYLLHFVASAVNLRTVIPKPSQIRVSE